MTSASRNYTLKDEVRDYWSDRAPTFDRSAAHRIEDRHGMPEWQALIRCAFDLGPTGNLAGRRALDIACGTGEISRVLTGLGAAVVAVDISETMLEIARDKLAGATWRGILADAEALHPLADASVDVAVTRHLAWTLTDPVSAYAEWRRVLKPDGRLLVVDGNWAAPRGRMMRVRHLLANAIDPTRAGSDEDATRHTGILSRLPYRDGLTAEILKHDLRKAGFERFVDIPIGRLHGAGMRNASLADRLRLSADHRFGIVAFSGLLLSR